ncbi:hypothetical protein MML48_1g18325 [Holotrichia oblita]|uniref:Uncharacterized protein n=1 Tax=Holotrichia oblita TaxID=644536 RepID=A0ACB9TYB8_HOLOL|nr:hypothetical protein MML48_1g18325 [Holotrichia oblita]
MSPETTPSCHSNDDIDEDDAKTHPNPEKSDDSEKDPSSPPPASATDDPTAAKFTNPKERQCWEMYRRMNDKGVAISFDTILRGMLTPTEYRLRRKPSLLPEDNDEIGGN